MVQIGHNAPRARQVNRGMVLSTLWRQGPLRRVEIAKATMLTPATITNLTGELIDEGLVCEAPEGPGRHKDRRGTALMIRAEAGNVIAVHVRSERVELATVDLLGSVTDTAEFTIPPEIPVATLCKQLVRHIAPLADRSGPPILGVGIGSAGQISTTTGEVIRFPSAHWTRVDFVKPLEDALGVAVVIDHNVRGMAVAETTLGRHRGIDNLLFVYVGRGVGAGAILGGNVFRGRSGSATELGHTVIMDNGPLCWCGNRGCLEQFTAEPALVRQAESLLGPLGGSNPIDSLVVSSNPVAINLLATAGGQIGLALANAITLLDVRTVVVGGRLFRSQVAFDALESALHGRYFSAEGDEVHVSRSTFDARVGVIGAGALALSRLLFSAELADTKNLHGRTTDQQVS